MYPCLKLDLCDKNNLQINYLKIRILSETSIPYLIRHASFIRIVSLHLWRRLCQQANIATTYLKLYLYDKNNLQVN